MDHVQSVRAALRAAAPVVAIPVEGKVPVCIRAKLLKGALKGVDIHSAVLLDNGCLKVTGKSGNVKTSSTFVPMPRHEALRLISDWSDRERRKRVKIINQGVLSAKEQRAMKLAQAEKAGIAELIQAQKEEQELLADARSRINPVLTPVPEYKRESIIRDHKAYREQRAIRKRGSVILWRIKTLKAELAKITVQKGKRRERKKTYARRQADIPKMLLAMREIASLEKQFEDVCPPVWRSLDAMVDGGYWRDGWIDKRPKEQAYRKGWSYYGGDEGGKDDSQALRNMAARLKHVRGEIKALTPPEDEETQEQIAA